MNDTAFQRHRHNPVCAEFHQLLHDKFHLVRLGQPLKKSHPRRQLQPVFFDKPQRTDNFLLQKLFDPAAVFLAVCTVGYCNFFARLHPKHIFNMVDIASRYHNPIALDLGRLHKKLIHLISDAPFGFFSSVRRASTCVAFKQ